MKQKKKICFFTISLAKGGAENQLIKLAIYFKKRGHEVEIIQALSQNDFEKILTDYEIPVHLIKYDTFKGIKQLFSYIKNSKQDIIISFMFGANLAARLVKKRFRIPLITSVRTSNISKFYHVLYKFSYKTDNFTVFNSQHALKEFVSNKLALPKKSIFIPNAVSIGEREFSRSKNKIFTLVSIAHFRPVKDYKTLFHAIKILKEKNIEIKLIVIGKIFELTWPESMIKELDLEQNIELMGFIQNPQPFLEKADALVLSSLWEGTPNAVLEAMANKLPIIASNIPSCEELITKGRCGYLFRLKDEEDLSSKIDSIISLSESEKEKLGSNGYEYVRENYSEKIVYKKWEALIDKI
jgi:glycosyltransferase involved in cell wall biosynthesis